MAVCWSNSRKKCLDTIIYIYIYIHTYITNHTKHYIINRLFQPYAVAQLVQALRYKPEGRGFYSPVVTLEFFIEIILPASL